MRIAVRLDRSRLLRWHLTLIEALQQNGHAVAAEFRPRTDPLPASLLAMLEFDAIARQFARTPPFRASYADVDCRTRSGP